MLEIDYITGNSAHTPGRSYTCEDQQSWKPPTHPIYFTVEITLAACK